MTPSREAGGRFLLEIGTEEMPARMIGPALKNELALGLYNEIVGRGLAPQVHWSFERNLTWFGTPRRLAVMASGILRTQPEREEEVSGPRVEAAYDVKGRPTKAAEGFARAHGVSVQELRRIDTPRGECVGVRRRVRGRPAAEVLAEAVPPLVASLAFPKTMRWGMGEHRFVRPIRWVVALLDEAVVSMTIAGVHSGRETSGHRVGGKGRVALESASDYVAALRENAVLADINERRKMIAGLIEKAAREAGGSIAPPPGGGQRDAGGDPELLDEVTDLVEWPCVISGEFDRAFLDLPAEILVTAMRHHQKYFSLLDHGGRLLNRFLAVANTREDRSQAIRRGNEWVLGARLADARFFWEDDRRTPLEARGEALERVTFHEKLGSYAAKTRRMARLAEAILPAFAESSPRPVPDAVARAVALCKNDLTTQMVKEFPELEGIVGGLYARADRLSEAVARAVYEHYLPGGADGPLPSTPESMILSLADRFDTQAGIFLLGIVPTGSRDPYALRRSVLGACRILIEARVHLSLCRLVDLALDGFDDLAREGSLPPAQARDALLEFYRGRLQYLGEQASLRHDSVRAALATSFDDPRDARLRMEALEAIRSDPGFNALVLAHKRIKNILPDEPSGAGVEPGRLKEQGEKDLHRALEAARRGVEAAVSRRDYLAALRKIAELGPPLERFFEEVMIMAEDRTLRANRLALLRAIARLVLCVGDFSEIVVEGEAPGAVVRGGEE